MSIKALRGRCDNEYDWGKLYAYYLDNYQWNKKMVNNNLKQLISDRSAYEWSEVDPKSIMIYDSNPEFLYDKKNSKCYFHKNNVLSTLDINGIEMIYPQSRALEALQLQAVTLPIAIDLEMNKSLKKSLSIQYEFVEKQMVLQK